MAYYVKGTIGQPVIEKVKRVSEKTLCKLVVEILRDRITGRQKTSFQSLVSEIVCALTNRHQIMAREVEILGILLNLSYWRDKNYDKQGRLCPSWIPPKAGGKNQLSPQQVWI